MPQPSPAPTQCPRCASLVVEMPVEIQATFNNGELEFFGSESDFQYIKREPLTCRCPSCEHEWSIVL